MAYLLKTLQMGTPATGLVVGRGAVEGELFVVSCIEDSAIKSVLTQEDDIVTKSMHKAPIVSMSMSNSAAGRKDVLVTADSENVIVLWNPIVGSVIRAFTPTVASRINAALLFHGPVEHAGNNDNMPSYTPMFDTQSDTTQSDPESLLILGHDNGNITIWDLNTDKCVNW